MKYFFSFLGYRPIDLKTQIPIPNNILKIKKITWVSFEFDHEKLPKEISALPFLKDCFIKIIKAIFEIKTFI